MPSQRRGRPAKVNRDAIVAAATALADEHGLSAVTMRAVASRLDVAPMTLYGHVANADELIDLVVAASIAAAVAQTSTSASLDESRGRHALTAFGQGFRELLLKHPAVLEAYSRRPIKDPTGLAVTNHIVASLAADGLDHAAAAEAYAAVYAYVIGFVTLEARPVDLDLAILDPHPDLAEARERIATLFDARSFTNGLAALIAGLTA